MQALETLESLSNEELLKAEKAAIVADPLLLVERGYLTIKTKGGELKPLVLNSAQKRLLDKIREIMAAGKPVRMWILKARQATMSTVVEAICYAMTSQREAVNALVVADDVDGSNYLFGMQKLFQEKLEPHLQPAIKHSNEKKLEFDHIHSQVLIDTSENLSAGRKYTFRIVHLSEVSRFRDLKELMIGINQSVPNLTETIVIGETTAAGMNQFYDEWVACEDAHRAGTGDWEPFFIPWFEVDEYKLALTGGNFYPIEAIEFVTVVERDNFLIDEKVLKQKYALSDEQINWRRWCIVNNCNRDVTQFNQEFPDCAKTAFVSTGDLFFDRSALTRQEICKPLSVGAIVKEDGRYNFRDMASGLFRIYEMPKRDGQYVIGADTAEGLEHGDKSAAVVLNKRTNDVVCVYNHNVPPDRFEEDLIKIGHFYNDALIACESNGYGYSVNQGLYKNYGNVYRRIKSKKGFIEQTLDIGWNTNNVTRPQMLAQFAEEIKNESTRLMDKDLIGQCWTFINNPKTIRAEAEKGKNDDLVVSRAIAGQVRMEKPYKERFVGIKKQRNFRGLSGY